MSTQDVPSPETQVTPDEAALKQVRALREELEAVRDVAEQALALAQVQSERVDELDARTDILRVRSEADELSAKQRRSWLLMHLRKKAEERPDKNVAAINAEEWKSFLNYPDGLDRTTFNQDLRRTFERNRHHPGLQYRDGELILDLEAGEPPEPEAVTQVPPEGSL